MEIYKHQTYGSNIWINHGYNVNLDNFEDQTWNNMQIFTAQWASNCQEKNVESCNNVALLNLLKRTFVVPSGNIQKVNWKITIEIVSFPMNSMVELSIVM